MFLGSNILVTICTDDNPGCAGNKSRVFGPYAGAVLPDFEGNISYVHTEEWNTRGVILYRDIDCRIGNADVFGGGYHNRDALNRSYIGNDSASGIYVDYGVKVTLFVDDDYQGQSKTIQGPARFCNFANLHFPQDTVSSLIVTVDKPIETKGYWTISGSGSGDITGGMTSSVTTSTSHGLSHTDETMISQSIEAGFEFEGLSESTSVSNEVSHSTTTSVEQVMQQSHEESCSASCANPKREQVVLFQWETLSTNVQGEGNSATIKTCRYQCRYGIDTQSRPKCPAGACKDSACNECYAWKKNQSLFL
jgi:hypothetical protein